MRIGILGGGQLAMMMIQMSQKHNFDFIVVDPSDNPPASKYAKHIKSKYNDKNTLNFLINECDVITIDFENVPADTLKYLEGKIKVFPNSDSVEVCQDRLKEKDYININEIEFSLYQSYEYLKKLHKIYFDGEQFESFSNKRLSFHDIQKKNLENIHTVGVQ